LIFESAQDAENNVNTAIPQRPPQVEDDDVDVATPAPSRARFEPVASQPSPSADTARVLETLLGNLDGMVYRCRNDAHWTMEFVSDGCARVTGYPPEDLLLNDRLSYEELTHPEDRSRVRTVINEALATRRRFELEYRIQHAEGGIRWVWERGSGPYDTAGNVPWLEGIIEDVTERKEADLALREAERRYHSLFDNAIEGIFRTSPTATTSTPIRPSLGFMASTHPTI